MDVETLAAAIKLGKGQKGDQGDPGFSPSAQVEQTATGARITVTDEKGTTTADLALDDNLYPRFGVSGVGQSESKLTRLWTSKEFSDPIVGTDTITASSPFDAYKPFNRKKCVGNWVKSADGTKAVFNVQAYDGDADYAEDGSMGDYVAIEIEPFYYFEEGDMLGVSEHQFPGWEIHPICVDYDGNIREKTYAPVYQLALKDGKAVSLPGLYLEGDSYMNLWAAGQTYENADVKDFVMLTPTAYEHYNYLLFTIEYATQNCQSFMQGAASMRFQSSGSDKIVATLTNKVVISGNLTSDYVVGQSVTFTDSAWSNSSYYDKHLITALARCDADGTENASGAYTLITYGGDDASSTVTLNTSYVLSMPWMTGATYGYAGLGAVKGHTGSPVSNTSGKYPMRYRHCENLWGNVFSILHDLADARVDEGNETYHLDWYYNADPRKVTKPYNFALSDLVESKGWVKLGVQTPSEQYKNGYIKELGRDDAYPFVRVPITISGGSTTYYCDYAFLAPSYVVRSVRRRGDLYTGSDAGLACFNAGRAPSSGSWRYGGELFFAQ